MKAYIVTLSMSLVLTIGTFWLVDAVTESKVQPVRYFEQVVRWVGGLE